MRVLKKSNFVLKIGLILFVLLQTSYFSFSENADSTKQVSHFTGSVLVTNKGISLIPSLTLGKPAAIFEFAVGNEKHSNELCRSGYFSKKAGLIFSRMRRFHTTAKIRNEFRTGITAFSIHTFFISSAT